MNKPKKNPENELIFKIQLIPRRFANGDQFWHCFGIGIRDGLYHEKGVWYLPNFEDKGEDYVKALKYRINTDELAFRWVLESQTHESLHFELLSEIGEESAKLDNIDKDKDGNYIISRIQGDLFNWEQI